MLLEFQKKEQKEAIKEILKFATCVDIILMESRNPVKAKEDQTENHNFVYITLYSESRQKNGTLNKENLIAETLNSYQKISRLKDSRTYIFNF